MNVAYWKYKSCLHVRFKWYHQVCASEVINPSHVNTVRLSYDCELVGKQVWTARCRTMLIDQCSEFALQRQYVTNSSLWTNTISSQHQCTYHCIPTEMYCLQCGETILQRYDVPCSQVPTARNPSTELHCRVDWYCSNIPYYTLKSPPTEPLNLSSELRHKRHVASDITLPCTRTMNSSQTSSLDFLNIKDQSLILGKLKDSCLWIHHRIPKLVLLFCFVEHSAQQSRKEGKGRRRGEAASAKDVNKRGRPRGQQLCKREHLLCARAACGAGAPWG